MNINAYPEPTAYLIRQALDEQRAGNGHIFSTLKRLIRTAKETGDDTLHGFALYQLADAYYTVQVDYPKFRDSLAKSIALLQRTADAELLTRAYNLVGIDASNNGSFDVAYYYYMMAMRTCESVNDDYLKGIVNANIGQIYFRLGNVKSARRFIRKSNRMLESGDTNDIYYYHNLINGQYFEAVLEIEAGNYRNVDSKERKIRMLEEKSGGTGLVGTRIPVALLRTQNAILKKDRALYEKRIAETFVMLQQAPQLFDFIVELSQFCMFLLAHDETEPVRRILDMIRGKVESTGIIQMMRVVSRIEISYYEKLRNEKEMRKQLRIQHDLSLRQRQEKNNIYLYSIRLISGMNEMRKDQARMIAENESLQEQARTDALTGIPNRLMMNKLLEEAFEYAYRNNESLCLEILDIDHFKEYNDTYGHRAGDACLQSIANELAQIALHHRGINCARYGGDEFVLIYEGMSDREIMEVARDLEKRVNALKIPHKGAPDQYISVSQGICNSVPGDKNKVYDYLSEADTALYAVKKNRAKRAGENTIRLIHLPESYG